MFKVWSTAPIPGMARYASRWVWLFHRKVPPRSLSPPPPPPRALAQPLGALRHRGERRFGGLPGRAGDGDHLTVAVDVLPVAEHPTHQQRGVLHGAQHDRSSLSAPNTG